MYIQIQTMKLLNWIIKFLTSRFFLVLAILLLQFFLLMAGFGYLHTFPMVEVALTIINVILTIYIVNRDVNTSFKLAWVLLIYAIPVGGSLIYLMFAEKKVPKTLRLEMVKTLHDTENILTQKKDIDKKIKNTTVRQQFNYVLNNAYYPYYDNTNVKYFSQGEYFYDDLLNSIRSAKKFIFLEFFIVKEGKMLTTITNLLKQKVEEGVKVYFMYDDVGSITTLPKDFEVNMSKWGINCIAFNPASIFLSLFARTNNRDHRKICVIDNKIGYMGGLNIGDEYINEVRRFGHWKDSAIRLEGEAVKSLTIMFIQFFNANAYELEDLDYEWFIEEGISVKSDTIVLPFSDSPTDDENVGKNVHYNMISKAKKYIYISTPYLILDHDLTESLKIASKNGVEVIITVPHIPDKKSVFMVTRSNYIPLLKAGVRIFEYTPGFIHSKMFVSDDDIGLVGTINMDFRSYYLHYECGTLITNDIAIKEMKKDYLDTLTLSHEISLQEAQQTNVIVRVFRSIMNVIAPLL